jgi:hypothetical protein
MKKEDSLIRKEIVIDVCPYKAAPAIGLLRGYLPSIMDFIESSMKPSGATFSPEFHDDIKEVLDEVYEKCIAQTDIRQQAKDFLEAIHLTAGVMPSDEVN